MLKNVKRNWGSIWRILLGCVLCTAGAYASRGDLVSFSGIAAVLGAVAILREVSASSTVHTAALAS